MADKHAVAAGVQVSAPRTRLAVLLAGPTCSGKSALAMDLAERLGGTVINADSMQLYRELRVLTARPTEQDEARVPHLLYGVRHAAAAASAAWWREAALAAMEATAAAGRLPILCGGTGLYFSALTRGLAPVPDPGAEARAEARALLTGEGPEALHARLARADPRTAARLRPSDSQRVARAWEVWRGTGTGLADWQARSTAGGGAPGWRFVPILLLPPRAALRAAIAARLDGMLEAGALGEVDALLAQGVPPELPAMRAHGVPELLAYRRGELTLLEASERIRLVTGQYTKRQATWFGRHALVEGRYTHTFIARYGVDVEESERFCRHCYQEVSLDLDRGRLAL